MSDRQQLINTDESPTSPSYGADDEKEDDETLLSGKPASTEEIKSKRKRGGGKRERLTRDPSLDKVDEDQELDSSKSLKNAVGKGCSNLSFGVKSYLHNFYDNRVYKDPNVYEEEDDDLRYLLHPHPRRNRCTSIWWKIFVWIGVNFLIFGIIGVLVGYLVPEREIILGSVSDNEDIFDKSALSYNFNLNVCKLVGLILFCIGGLTLTVALLFPSFLYQYIDESRRDGSFKVKVRGETDVPSSPLEKNIPISGMVTNVQPERKANESILTKEGMVPYHD